jgi:hypothetical protein|nr:MAG TPA: hypothetical protein [Caudoviricetes sp.]
MKYIVFEQDLTGLKMPVVFPDHITHSQIKIEGSRPVSAGFCQVGTEEIVTIEPHKSDSLNLAPMPGDRELIVAVFCNAGIYAFMGIIPDI